MGKGHSALVLRKQYSGVEDYGKPDSMPLEGCSSTPEQFITATETLGFSIAEFSDTIYSTWFYFVLLCIPFSEMLIVFKRPPKLKFFGAFSAGSLVRAFLKSVALPYFFPGRTEQTILLITDLNRRRLPWISDIT